MSLLTIEDNLGFETLKWVFVPWNELFVLCCNFVSLRVFFLVIDHADLSNSVDGGNRLKVRDCVGDAGRQSHLVSGHGREQDGVVRQLAKVHSQCLG